MKRKLEVDSKSSPMEAKHSLEFKVLSPPKDWTHWLFQDLVSSTLRLSFVSKGLTKSPGGHSPASFDIVLQRMGYEFPYNFLGKLVIYEGDAREIRLSSILLRKMNDKCFSFILYRDNTMKELRFWGPSYFTDDGVVPKSTETLPNIHGVLETLITELATSGVVDVCTLVK